MAIIKTSKLRESTDVELQGKLLEYQRELNTERGMLATGGRTSNPGKISQLKKTIARLYTIVTERKLGINAKSKSPAPQKDQKPAAAEQKNEVNVVG
jgi:large subunit ribosomal protein L29